jgi:hypothetical protein
MKNLYLIPTDKPSRLIIYSTLLNEFRLLNDPIEDWKHKKHIYITNSEEIKVGDYVYCNREGFKSVLKQKVNPMGVNNDPLMKKIILTTDVDLINDGVQVIDDEFLEWFVENPSCESVKVKTLFVRNVTGYGAGGDVECYYTEEYKIIIPKEEPNYNMKQEIEWVSNNLQCKQIDSCYNSLSKKCICPKEELSKDEIDKFFVDMVCNPKEEPKQETLEEAAESYAKPFENRFWVVATFKEGAKWQQERMYSEEEVEQIFNIGQMVKNYGDYKPHTFKEALKQIKKK